MRRLIAALGLMALAAVPAAAQQAPLVADLSKHLVAITTGFSGTDVLLFGAVDGPGDIVVVVRGPDRDEVVRRKERIAGIWVNTAEAVIPGAPSFYRVAATRPLEDVAPVPVLERHEIGHRHLDLEVAGADAAAADAYRDALVRLKQKRTLYGDEILPVSFLGSQLFRTEMHLPANVPVGTYSVEVYLLRDGEVISAQTTPLIVSKVGVGAEVYDFAHDQGPLYGIIAILVAMGAGWLAATAFKKS